MSRWSDRSCLLFTLYTCNFYVGYIDKVCDIASLHSYKPDIQHGLDSLVEIGEQAVQTNTLVLVDAEYTWINPALSILTQALSLIVNNNKAVVWNTFQCYLKVTSRASNLCFAVRS